MDTNKRKNSDENGSLDHNIKKMKISPASPENINCNDEKVAIFSDMDAIDATKIFTIAHVNKNNYEEALSQLEQLAELINNKFDEETILVLGQVERNCSKLYGCCDFIDYSILNEYEKTFFDIIQDHFETAYFISRRKLNFILSHDNDRGYLNFALLEESGINKTTLYELNRDDINELNITPELINKLEEEKPYFLPEDSFCKNYFSILNVLHDFRRSFDTV